MHQTRKGNQWYFGMKAHIGMDAGTGYVHSVTATAANLHDLADAQGRTAPPAHAPIWSAGPLCQSGQLVTVTAVRVTCT